MVLQVHEAVEEWREILPVREQADFEAEFEKDSNKIQWQSSASKAGSSPGATSSSMQNRPQARKRSKSNDDDGTIITEALGLNEAIAVSKTTYRSLKLSPFCLHISSADLAEVLYTIVTIVEDLALTVTKHTHALAKRLLVFSPVSLCGLQDGTSCTYNL